MQYPDFVENKKILIHEDNHGTDSFRYSLEIPFLRDGNKKYTVIMMNPSKADIEQSDPTIDRILRYIEKNDSNVTSVSIVNLYAERETYSESLKLNEQTHSENMATIKKKINSSDEVILGWGKPTQGSQERLHELKYHHIACEVLEVCCELNYSPKIIESLIEGIYPRHPGRIGYSYKLDSYDIKNHIRVLKNRISKNNEKFGVID